MIGKYCGNVIPAEIISQSNNLWISFHSNLADQAKGFMLTTEPMVGGCGGVYHGLQGEIFSPQYPKAYPNNAECVWEISVADGYHIGLIFINRFQLEQSQNCAHDYIEVFDFKNDDWLSLGKVCGRDISNSYNSTGKQMKVIFRSNDAVTGDGFTAQWNANCGGTMTSNKGRLISPGYPNDYARYLKCEYKIIVPEKYIRAEFKDFQLEEGHSSCVFDNVTISISERRRRLPIPNVLGPYCGSNVPPFVRAYGMITLTFETDGWLQNRGFLMEYEVEKCGGYINESTIISSPSHPESYYGSLNCTWVIEAPQNQVVLLTFSSFDLERSHNCQFDWVSVYNSSVIDSKKRMARFCGNMTDQPPIVKSSTRDMIVQFTTDASVHLGGFKAAVSFTYGEQSGCGGTVTLLHGSTTSIRSPDIIGNDYLYEPFMDCHWLIIGAPEDILHLDFKSMDLIPSPCGDNKLLTVNNVTQYLTSPNYPNDYPNNLRCVWLLSSEESFRFDIHFMDLDLEESTYCENDWLSLRDTSNSRAPMQKFKFCGVGHPSDYYSASNKVEVSFVTNSAISKRGFKLSYQFEGCNRNFTGEQGRISNSNSVAGSRCHVTIQAKPNHTISLYFNEFFFANSEGCLNAGMEVRDGLSNDAPVIIRMCSHRLPDPIFSTSSTLSLSMWSGEFRAHDRYDITYTTTDKGRGCGGKLFNYGGKFTSPFYPSDVRNSSFSCRWEVSVPEGYFASLLFE
ncbi:hypothetical protein J437_LFUL018813, partial [Ladona fulva]